MIQMAVRICRIDERPVERSAAYKLLRLCCGERIANQMTYEVYVPKADDT